MRRYILVYAFRKVADLPTYDKLEDFAKHTSYTIF